MALDFKEVLRDHWQHMEIECRILHGTMDYDEWLQDEDEEKNHEDDFFS